MSAKAFSVGVVVKLKDALTGPLGRLRNTIRTRLIAPLKAALGPIKSVASGMTSLAKKATLAALAIGASGIAIAKSYATSTDELAKFSRQVGFGIEALQELEFAADRQGIPMEDFRGMLRQLSKNMGEAQAGTGRLAKILKTMPKEFQAQVKAVGNNEEALDLWLAALRKIPDASKRAALAQKVFGGSGQEILRLAEASAEAINELRATKRGYGVITEEAGTAAEGFVDSLANMNAAIGGVKAAIGGQLLPVLQPLIEQFTEWVSVNREMISLKVREFFTVVFAAIKAIDWDAVRAAALRLYDAIVKIGEALGGVKTVAIAFGAALGISALSSVVGMISGLGGLATAVKAVGAAFLWVGKLLLTNPWGIALLAIGAAIYLLVDNWEAVKAALIQGWDNIKRIAGVVGDALVATWVGFKDGAGRAIQAFGKLAQAVWDGLGKGLTWVYEHTLEPIFDLISSALDGVKSLAQWAGLVDDGPAATPMTQGPGSRIRDAWALAGQGAGLAASLAGQSDGSILGSLAATQQAIVGGRIQVDITGPPGTRVSESSSANPSVPITARLNIGRRTAGGLP